LTVNFLGGDLIKIGGGEPGPFGIRLCLNLAGSIGSYLTACILIILGYSDYLGVYFTK